MMADFHDLVGIPGFYVDDGGYWNIAGYSGLLVPYCDKSGLIQGMQIRLDDENKPDRKYRWLSSKTRKFGTLSRSWLHVTGNIHAKTAYFTEGGLKGDVASVLDNDALFICFAGINAIGGLKETLAGLSPEWEELTVPLDELDCDPPKDLKKAEQYRQLLLVGNTEFLPLVCINRMVIDGQHRFWAYQQLGYQTVRIYQNSK